jgi:hypothetical protein
VGSRIVAEIENASGASNLPAIIGGVVRQLVSCRTQSG